MRKELKVQLTICWIIVRNLVLLPQELIKLLPVLSASFAIPARRVCAPQSLPDVVGQSEEDAAHLIQSICKSGLQPKLAL